MDYYISKPDSLNYLKLPSAFDFDLVDQDLGFSKIFEFFPKEVYLSLNNGINPIAKTIFEQLTKAAVHYAFVFSLPRIKVQITNFGIQEFTQEKMKSSSWWDVRDLGISLVKIADKLVSDSLSTAFSIEGVKSELPFFQNVSDIISTPAEFQSIYSINHSPEVFVMLQQLIEQSLETKIKRILNDDCVELVKQNPKLLLYLKKALAYYSLSDAAKLRSFTFLQNAVAIQYEELPWQKSIILSDLERSKLGHRFCDLGDENLKIITDFIKKNSAEFPCYSEPIPPMQMRSAGFGISLF
ncbi:MAG: hypothetical protein LBE36_06360 [Flavobacteriaceae bacterium]|jgi:hypothetical protein|nr:hypothetical protein [Flavobacteriaceae bacterium]